MFYVLQPKIIVDKNVFLAVPATAWRQFFGDVI